MKLKTINDFTSFLIDLDAQKKPCGFLAGGTNIMMDEKRNTNTKDTVYNISNFSPLLDYIKEYPDHFEIGALTTFDTITKDDGINNYLPQLIKASLSIGSVQVRNMGTLAGNLANASSVGDAIPVLQVLDSGVIAISVGGERRIALADFFVDYKTTSLRHNEIIKAILIPKNKDDGRYDFFKIALRPTAAVSKFNLAYAFEDGKIKLASGGVAKLPVRLYHVEKLFNNDNLTQEAIEQELKFDINPIDDNRSTASYRSSVLAKLIYSVSLSL